MAILQLLGIDFSIVLQFAIFVTAIVFLSIYVFGPYLRALQAREERTLGGEELAVELQKETADLQSRYETKARSLSLEIKTIFDKYRDEASKEQEKVVSQARTEAQKLSEETNKKLTIEISDAQKKLKQDIPAVAQVITQKILMK